MSLFQIQAASDAWITQNLKTAYEEDPLIKSEWWYPLAISIKSTEYRSYEEFFVKVDKDKSGTLELSELTKARWPFGIKLDGETCKRLMRIFDLDCSGTINFFEYLALLKFVEFSVSIFKKFDSDNSGKLELNELIVALPEMGFDLDEKSCKSLMKICGKGLFKPKIELPQFIACVSLLGQTRSIYCHSFNKTANEIVKEDFNKFVTMVIALADLSN
ncbi:Grainin [Entamoeba marina]